MNQLSYPKYRYVILSVFMLITVAIEIQWLTHAAVARPAEVFYAGQFSTSSFFNIDFLAMVYMLAFLIFSFPASYIIDTYGIKAGLTIGAALLGVFSLLKAVFADSFTGVMIAQCGLAVAQPFILNAVTAVTVRWFSLTERGTAAGLLALAQYVGIIVAMLVTPALVGSDPSAADYGSGFASMLWIYAGISIVAAILALLFLKEKPVEHKDVPLVRHEFFKGLKLILSKRDMLITIGLFMIGLGVFNAISSMTDSIAEHFGIADSDGLIGGLMLIGGILGAIVLPILSDKYRKRKLFLVICIAGFIPGVFGLAMPDLFTSNPDQMYTISLVSSFILGFFIMSAGPIGFQYAAEISAPAPESASQGILLWIGQLTGMVFVAGMSANENAKLGTWLIIFFALSFITFAGVLFLKESKVIQT